ASHSNKHSLSILILEVALEQNKSHNLLFLNGHCIPSQFDMTNSIYFSEFDDYLL
ncbi:300_t:CDS:1, partial [Dentiscutata erythropus]